MKMKLMFAALFALIAASPAAAQDSTWTWHKAIPAGQSIQIKNIIGDISATPASGNQAEVVARIHGRMGGRRDVEIHVVEHSKGVTICAIYEDSNDCEPSGRQYSNGSRDDRVEFEVRVPRGVELNAQSVTGDVVATGMTADVQAASVSGNVRVQTTGFVMATSVSGSVNLKMGRSDWEGTMSVTTVSGDITLEVPDLNATVSFRTVSGDLESDWPISLKSSGSHGSVSGTIGSGGRKLSISTVSGDVELRKAD